MLAAMVGLYLVREPFLRVEFGTSIPLIGLALVTLCAAAALFMKRRKHLTFKMLSGFPELSPDHYPGELLTQGIYGKIRHPRYVEVLLGTLSYALAANYFATYALVAPSVPTLYLIVLLEERELRDRFGSAYDEYCRRTPRFLPSIR
jgi:protein-S-isoprenylcysteine O-methyltransferase Ste14